MDSHPDMSEDDTAGMKTSGGSLENLFNVLASGNLQDGQRYRRDSSSQTDNEEEGARMYHAIQLLGDFVQMSTDITEEVLMLLATQPLSVLNLSKLAELTQSGKLGRFYVYLALAARQEDDVFHTLIPEFIRISIRYREKEHIIEYLLDNKADLVHELFLLTIISGEDWLSYIVKLVANSVSSDKFLGNAKSLLECSPLTRVWELVLLHLLQTGCRNEDLLRTSLQIKDQEEADPALVELSSYLVHRITLLNWLGGNTFGDRPVTELKLTPLSALRLLHQSCILSNLDWDQTHAYLVESVESGGVSKWEPSFFDAALALTWVLEAIQLESAGLSKGSEPSSCLSAEQHYRDNVVNRLSRVKKILDQLQPLTLRTEVLENIFTLLLIRHEDFFDEETDRMSESGTEEEDGKPNISTFYDASLTDVSFIEARICRLRRSSVHDNTGNSSPPRKQGFLCGPNITRDLLLMLEQSVQEASKSLYSHLSAESMEWEVPSLISQQELQTQMKQLSNYIVDALWRLRVVTSPHFLRSEGRYVGESSPCSDLPVDWTYIDPCQAESESDDESTAKIQLKKPAKLKKLDADRSSSGSSSPVLPTGQSNKASWKNRRRSQCFPCFVPENTATIQRMLCTPASLTNLCLLQGDLEKAANVVQVFSLGDTISGAEVRFSENYRKLHRVHGTPTYGNKRKHFSSQNTTLQAVQRAASAGVQALQINYEIDQLLSGVLPEVPHVNEICEGSSKQHAVAVVAADVTLTLAQNAQQARSFIALAAQRSPELAKLHPSSHSLESAAYCFIPFLRSLLQVTETSEEGSPLALLQRWDLDDYSVRSIRDHIQFGESLNSALAEWYTNQDDSAFSKLVQAAALVSSLKGSDTGKFAYLQELQSYLQLLQKILIVPPSLEAAGVSQSQYTSLLQCSPFDIFMSLFEQGAPIYKLESAAANLGLSLSFILPVRLIQSPPAIRLPSGSKAVVLNDGAWPAAARKPALVASSLLEGVLHELLVQWKELQLVNGRECRNLPVSLANSSRLQAVLADTKELAFVDLDLLQEGEETAAFFCNVTNLLMLHALLHTVLNNGDTSALTSLNSSQRMCFQSTLFYRVGQLGLISLWQILQMTLGNEVVGVPSPTVSDFLLKRKFHFEARDSRIILAIATGRPTSPVVQVMRARRLNEQLDGAVREYIRFWARLQENKLQVPSLTEQYLKFAALPFNHLLQYFQSSPFAETETSNPEELELSVFPEKIREPVFVLTYGTTNNWQDIEEHPVDLKRDVPNELVSNIVSYLESHCWPVALLVRLLCGTGSNKLLNDSQIVVRRFLKSPDVLDLAALLGVSVGHAAIHACVPNSLLWSSLRDLIEKTEWKKVHSLLSALPTYQRKEDAALKALRDVALLELILEGPSSSNPTPWRLCYHLSSTDLRIRCALTCASSWPGEECCEILSQLAQERSKEEFSHAKTEVINVLAKVTVCQEVLNKVPLAEWSTWKDVLDCGETEPLELLENIKDPALCLRCLQLFTVPNIPKTNIERIVRLLLQVDISSLPVLQQVLSKLPLDRTAHTLVKFLPNVTSVALARFLLRFLDTKCRSFLSPSDLEILQLSLLGLQMIEVLPGDDQEECLRLMTQPHLLLEQMLMNMRLEAVGCMLAAVRENLTNLSPLSTSSVDLLLRTYAEKALDFRVAVAHSDHSDTSFSISSCTSSRGRDFVMPFNVPSKSEWIPNEKAAVCMSCCEVAFSMFNRRHHCRQCGRVVCAACSVNRMQVEGYGALKVRVCADCFSQSTRGQGQPSIESSSSKYEPHKLGSMACSSESVWQLTSSQSVNNTIRDEFAYEHAPSVSLCLSILQLHSQHPACPSFLLDCCEKILDHLKPIAPSVPNPEVDYSLVIEMCGSLVVAAKVKCAQWGYTSGVVDCDRKFSQIDLYRLLVDHGCAGLIMYEVKLAKGGTSLVSCAEDLRHLRSQLLKQEFWELALEVSTKGGLDRNGVWAAWGKGCLQAGCWEKAREKLAHCFVVSPGSSRPTKDSPLLLEILQILENLPKGSPIVPIKSQKAVSPKQKSTGIGVGKGARLNAETVLLSLASLQDIAQGKLQQVTSSSNGIESQIYKECCYYLRTYGSHTLYLHFLLRHRDLERALRHVRDNALDAQQFLDWLYIPCLKSGLITNLHSAMTSMDSSLNDWKEYLRGVCGILEKRRMLHVLYEIQQWAGDHVRAAMTCIRFFRKGATSYSELVGRLKHLKHAQAHLDAALAEFSAIQGQSSPSFPKEMVNISNQAIPLLLPAGELRRHQTTIWRQIELTKYLANCEASGRPVLSLCDPPFTTGSSLPTLFNCAAERDQLAVLAILCGTDVEEGFGIAIRIVGDFKLNALEMYKRVAVGLVRQQRAQDVLKLLECIRSSGEDNMDKVKDDVLLASVEAAGDLSPAQSEMLVKNIIDNEIKIKAYIACHLLKSAYLLAVKCDRVQDVETVLAEAERLGQSAIRNICLKRLGRS